MANKKDSAVVAVITDLTPSQAASISKEIMRAKSKHAPTGRGTIASGLKKDVGVLIQGNNRKVIGEHINE